MKNKALLLIVSLLLLTYVGIAQDSRSDLHFGPKLGFNLSNVYDAKGEDFDADAKIGLAGGIFVSIPVGPFIGFHPEVLFSQKGYTASGSVLGSNYTFARTLNYIDVPLLLEIKPHEMFTIVVGPQYSYLLSRKDVFESSFLNVEQEDQFKNENLLKNTLCFLGGFDVNVNKLVVGARAGWDLFNNNGDETTTTPRYKNVWFQVTVGFQLL